MENDVEVELDHDQDDTFYSLAAEDTADTSLLAAEDNIHTANVSLYQDTLNTTLEADNSADDVKPDDSNESPGDDELNLDDDRVVATTADVTGATEDIAAEDIAADVTGAPEDIAAEDVAAEDVAAEDIAAEDVAAEDISAEDVAPEDSALDGDYLDSQLDEFSDLDTIRIPTAGVPAAEVASTKPTDTGPDDAIDPVTDPDYIDIRGISPNLPSDFTATSSSMMSPDQLLSPSPVESEPYTRAHDALMSRPVEPQPAAQPLSPSMQFISLSDSSDNVTSQFSDLGQTEISRFSDSSDTTRSGSSSRTGSVDPLRPGSVDPARPDNIRPNSVDFGLSDVVELPIPVVEKPQVTTPTSYFGAPSATAPSTFVQQNIAPEPDLDEIPDSSVDSELWLPSPDTLELVQQSNAGTLDPQFLTKARPNSTVAFVSPAVELVMKYHGEMAAQRLQTTLPPVSESNLRHLVKEGRLLSAVNMLTELLNTADMSVKTVRLWALRFALLVKLKLYSTAEVEMAMFGNLDNCDLYHEFYPKSGRKGSIIPWSFRLLWSILPLHCPAIGGLYGALDRMYGLVYHLDQALVAGLPYVQEQRVIKYKTSLLVQVAGALAGSGSIQPAIKLLKQIRSFQTDLSLSISNAMIRLYYQVGNIFKGEALLAEIQDKLVEEDREMNAGFKCIAHGEYNEAYQHFARVVNLNPGNTVASINGAVCLLYLGRLGDSIIQFEGAIKTSLHPMLIFNLVSLYELKTVASTSKKYHLLDTITSKSDWEAFPFECLRL